MIDGTSLSALDSYELKRREMLQAAWVVLLSSALPALAQNKLPKMRVGFIAPYTPYSFVLPDGRLTGFDVDVVKALLALSGYELEPVADTLPRLQQKLESGEIAFIGNQLLMTPENRRRYDFVRAYASIQLVSVLHEDDERYFLSLDDFLGKKLGVLVNTDIEDQARAALGKAVQTFNSIEDALRALADRQLDAVLEENLIADYFIDKHHLPLKVSAPMASLIRVGLAVPKGHKEIQQKLSAGVQTLLKDPGFKIISERWFGYDVSRPRVSHAPSG